MVNKKSNKNYEEIYKSRIMERIIISSFILGLILLINRYDIIIESGLKICLNESVRFGSEGILQLLRSFIEHVLFNFLVPISFVIFFRGYQILVNQEINKNIFIWIGISCSIAITILWEFQKRPVEYIEVAYDLLGVFLSYRFLKWQPSIKKSKTKTRGKK